MSDIYKNTSFTKEEIQNKKSATSEKNWGVSHPMHSQEVKEKLKNVFLEKYGVNNPSKDPGVIEKIRNVSLEKYGVDNPSKDPGVIEKIRADAKARWSDPICKAAMLEKRKKTNMEKFGVEWNSQRPEHSILSKITSNERYGTDYPMQNNEIHDRSTKNSKMVRDYTLPSGNVVRIQGYENWAIELLLQTYPEDKLYFKNKDKPSIKYTFGGKDRIYRPDIYILDDNLIIEVKSDYTYNKEKSQNLEKQKACISAGYKFMFIIFNKQGHRINDN